MKPHTQHISKDANRRKHTAKELTTDLGINTYDFTARSQYPMASRFDQPDKKSGDYTWLSPYIFCAADPINFSDPTGMDTWGINSRGQIEYRIKQNYDDQIIITNKRTEANTLISASFEYRTVKDAVLHADPKGNSTYSFTRLDTRKGEASMRLYAFLASNTGVEWGYMDTSKDTYITTSNEKASEGGSPHIATAFGNNGYEVSTHIHSHPSNTKQPSGMEDGATSGDVKFAQSLDAITGGGTKFFIFIPENQSLIPYRGKSVPGDFTEDKLQQIKLDDYIKTR